MLGVTHPHAALYLETFDALDEVTGIVLYDPDDAARARAAAANPKVVAHSADLAAVLAQPEVTHTVVAVPTDQSVATLVAAIQAGKAVFTEKPGARNAAEFAPVLAALEENRVPFVVAYLNRWLPALVQLRELYQGGAIGRLLAIELRVVTTQVRFRRPQHWLFQKEIAGGGILSWLGCHWLDFTRYVTGEELTQVSAQLATTNGEPITVEDTATVTFKLSGGALGSLHAGYLLAAGTPGYAGTSYDLAVYLRGTLGTVAYQRDRDDERLVCDTTAQPWCDQPPPVLAPPEPARGYGGAPGLAFFRAFLQARAGDPVPAGPLDTLRILQLLDAIYAAAATGRTMAVPDAVQVP